MTKKYTGRNEKIHDGTGLERSGCDRQGNGHANEKWYSTVKVEHGYNELHYTETRVIKNLNLAIFISWRA